MKLPSARTAELIERDLGKELLIHDLRINKAYTLNETLMKVYRACASAQTFDDLRRHYRFTDDLIHYALGELQDNNLITGYESNHFAGLSKRQVIRRVGLASEVTLPVIAALVAPPPAAAAQPASDTCLVGTCIPYPQPACPSECSGRTLTYEVYNSIDGSCTGPNLGPTTINCPLDGWLTDRDWKITVVT